MSISKVILFIEINEVNVFYVWFKKFALDEDFVIFEKPDNISPVFSNKILFICELHHQNSNVGSSALCPNDVARLFPYTYVHNTYVPSKL